MLTRPNRWYLKYAHIIAYNIIFWYCSVMTNFDPTNPIFVSTHLDDVVLSCAYYVGEHPGTQVATVMAGAPDIELDDWSARTTGHLRAQDALRVRTAEDNAAMEALGAVPTRLDLWDLPYLNGQPRDPDTVYRALATSLPSEVESIVGPLGLTHPDHRVVSDACIRLARDLGLALYLYADLPYGHTYPRNITDRLAELAVRGLRLTQLDPVKSAVDKPAVCDLYATQMDELRGSFKTFDASLSAPEQYWRVQ